MESRKHNKSSNVPLWRAKLTDHLTDVDLSPHHDVMRPAPHKTSKYCRGQVGLIRAGMGAAACFDLEGTRRCTGCPSGLPEAVAGKRERVLISKKKTESLRPLVFFEIASRTAGRLDERQEGQKRIFTLITQVSVSFVLACSRGRPAKPVALRFTRRPSDDLLRPRCCASGPSPGMGEDADGPVTS
jgi:hypothetical protein